MAELPKAAQGSFDELLAGVEPDLAAIARRLRAIIRAVDVSVVETVRLGDNAATYGVGPRKMMISGSPSQQWNGTRSGVPRSKAIRVRSAVFTVVLLCSWPQPVAYPCRAPSSRTDHGATPRYSAQIVSQPIAYVA